MNDSSIQLTVPPVEVENPTPEQLAKLPQIQKSRRPVVVLAVDPDCPFSLKPGYVFPTASAAARSIGLPPTAWASRFQYCSKGILGAPAKIRGVTFSYLADYEAAQAKAKKEESEL